MYCLNLTILLIFSIIAIVKGSNGNVKWIEGKDTDKEYHLYEDDKNVVFQLAFHNAKEYCDKIGGSLPMIKTMKEREAMKMFIRQEAVLAWLGAEKVGINDEKTVFRWVDGTDIDF